MIPRAIASYDDLHAWLVRGLVEAGLPDHTGGGVAWLEDGALNVESLFVDQGASGLALEFAGLSGEEHIYVVKVVSDESGTRIVARCPDTLFHHIWAGADPTTLGADIAGNVRRHHAAFLKWRGEGGEPSYAERMAIPDAAGTACDRGLVVFLERLRKERKALSGGPKAGWWVTERHGVGTITAGLGKEPEYRLRPEVPAASMPENIEHAERLRGIGGWMIGSGVLAAIFVCLGLSWSGYSISQVGVRGLWGESTWLGASVVLNMGFCALQVAGGFSMRTLRRAWIAKLAAWLGMVPCFAPCCLTGLPIGIWAALALRDERTAIVFR